MALLCEEKSIDFIEIFAQYPPVKSGSSPSIYQYLKMRLISRDYSRDIIYYYSNHLFKTMCVLLNTLYLNIFRYLLIEKNILKII